MSEGWFPRFNAGDIQLKRLMRQLEIDEGRRLKAYKDTENLLTVGIGHLIKPTDPSEIRNLKEGDSITSEQMYELFQQDLAVAISDFRIMFPDWETYPAEAQEVLINMLFNLGRAGVLKFKKMIAAVYEKNWGEAANQMEDSKWFGQVGNRAKRLVSHMRTIHGLSV